MTEAKKTVKVKLVEPDRLQAVSPRDRAWPGPASLNSERVLRTRPPCAA
jgi:hypothetical protein